MGIWESWVILTPMIPYICIYKELVTFVTSWSQPGHMIGHKTFGLPGSPSINPGSPGSPGCPGNPGISSTVLSSHSGDQLVTGWSQVGHLCEFGLPGSS